MTMKEVVHTILVQLASRSYDIVVRRGLLANVAARLQPLNLGKRCLVITDRNVARRYGAKTIAALKKGGYDASLAVISAGEKYKTLATVERLYNACLDAKLSRDSFIIGLGGGVVGDMAGFVAASYLRGIDFVQIPTTLVAQVDAAIGGKTGVNLARGKNLVGAFWQPRLVLCDLDTLKTLPPREYRSGWAEVIKYGIIRDAELFGALEKYLQDEFELRGRGRRRGRLNDSTIQHLNAIPTEVVARCCQIKAEIVSADERESGQRALLNFGHTLGHALEAATNYKKYLHGEAISIGMVAAAQLSVKHARLPQHDADRIRATLESAGLPTQWPKNVPIKKILTAIRLDKKVRAGKLYFVLARRLGDAFVSDSVTMEDVKGVVG